jgi:hypothetical protein
MTTSCAWSDGDSLGVRTSRRQFLARNEKHRSWEVKKKRRNNFDAEVGEEETQRTQRRGEKERRFDEGPTRLAGAGVA